MNLTVQLWPICLVANLCLPANSAELNIFKGSTDVGRPSQKGSAFFDPQSGAYVVTGGGENMWFTNDAFHFVWTKVSGDFALSAALEWVTSEGNAHRKGCLVVRQDLTADSAYIDVALHGDGLTSLQFRDSKGGMTQEIRANESKPSRAAIERQGDTFVMLVGSTNGSLKVSGAFSRVKFQDPVYVGLAVCAHDDNILQQARFKNVELTHPKRAASAPELHCTLETVSIDSRDRRAIYHTLDHIEAPNWSPDGKYLLFNSKGGIYRLDVGGGAPMRIDTAFANKCNNDHGISPDGKYLAISDQSKTGKSLIYVLPIEGGTPRQITPLGPSYWHGWSPDGKTLAYCAERRGEYDVYTIPVAGGEETRLTTAGGLDDGPEYSPDGKYIYFNSDRTGTMQIWRMKPDGTQQQQITNDQFNNWFAHPSPDGEWLVFLSYEPEVKGHPPNKPVRLRIMRTSGGAIKELTRLFGGQGTINVPSWAPDSKQVAFVSYELLR